MSYNHIIGTGQGCLIYFKNGLWDWFIPVKIKCGMVLRLSRCIFLYKIKYPTTFYEIIVTKNTIELWRINLNAFSGLGWDSLGIGQLNCI